MNANETKRRLQNDIRQLEALIAGLGTILAEMQQRLEDRPGDVSLRTRCESQKHRQQMAQKEHIEMTKLLEKSTE